MGEIAHPVGRYLFEDAPPVPPHVAARARPFVARAKLGFKDFRKELERVGSTVVKAKADGLLTPDDATLIWLDAGGVLSIPLIDRYLEARAFDPVDRWLRARPGFAGTPWLTGYVRHAMEGFVSHGEAARAGQLALAHAERAMKSLRLDWKERRRGIPKALAPDAQATLRKIQRALIDRIPVRNADMLNEIGEMTPLVRLDGAASSAALAAIRDEIVRDMDRFPAV